MKRKKLDKSIIAIAIVLGITLFSLAGCQSKTAAAATTTPNRGSQPSAAAMKKQMQVNIKPLVDAKTITQAQADTIISTMTVTTGKGFGSRTAGANGSKFKGSTTKQSGQAVAAKGNAGANGKAGYGQNKSGFNPLSKLVTDKTVTQAQADAVMKVIRNGIGRQGGNNTQAPATN